MYTYCLFRWQKLLVPHLSEEELYVNTQFYFPEVC